MKKVISMLTFSLLFTSCATLDDGDPRKGNHIDSRFITYVSEFESIYNVTITNIPITFTKVDNDSYARCMTYTYGGKQYKEILVDEEDWYNLGEYRRYILIFHELGHCYYDMDHRDGRMGDWCPSSIMNTVLMSRSCAKKYWNYYIDEFLER